MTGKVLLDTNIVIALLEGDSAVLQQIARSEETLVSVTVLGELFYGARNSAHVERNLARLDAFASAIGTVLHDLDTARQYGHIKSILRQKGRPIPENDVWIAAAAIRHDLTLITRDEHFAGVEELKTERW